MSLSVRAQGETSQKTAQKTDLCYFVTTKGAATETVKGKVNTNTDVLHDVPDCLDIKSADERRLHLSPPFDKACCSIIFLSQSRTEKIKEQYPGLQWDAFYMNSQKQVLSCMLTDRPCTDMCLFDNTVDSFLSCNGEPFVRAKSEL